MSAFSDFVNPLHGTPVVVRAPQGRVLPLVCDAPHSGRHYPAEAGMALPWSELCHAESRHIPALWERMPQHGATLIEATFARTYVDPYGAAEEAQAPWPHHAQHAGAPDQPPLFWQQLWRNGVAHPLYDQPLTPEAMAQRVAHYWQPYHDALVQAVRWSLDRFGRVWHISVQVQPAPALSPLYTDADAQDFVVSDRGGYSCEPAFAALIVDTLRSMGYRVGYNAPLEGADLLEQLGEPHAQRHSVQVAVAPRLYMDPTTGAAHEGLATLQHDLDRLGASLAAYVRNQVGLGR